MNLIFKIAWVLILCVSIYFFGWLTFMFYVLDDFGENKYSIFNLVIPNFLTIIILFIYTKELLFGYHARSKGRNIKSLLIILFVILFLAIVQFSQFEFMTKDLELTNIITTLVWITIFTSYVGVLLNRILSIKSLNLE